MLFQLFLPSSNTQPPMTVPKGLGEGYSWSCQAETSEDGRERSEKEEVT